MCFLFPWYTEFPVYSDPKLCCSQKYLLEKSLFFARSSFFSTGFRSPELRSLASFIEFDRSSNLHNGASALYFLFRKISLLIFVCLVGQWNFYSLFWAVWWLNLGSLGSMSRPEAKSPSSQQISEEKSWKIKLKSFFRRTKLGRIHLQHRKTVNFADLDEVSAFQGKFVLKEQNLQIFHWST
jgi:hypothetical protein